VNCNRTLWLLAHILVEPCCGCQRSDVSGRLFKCESRRDDCNGIPETEDLQLRSQSAQLVKRLAAKIRRPIRRAGTGGRWTYSEDAPRLLIASLEPPQVDCSPPSNHRATNGLALLIVPLRRLAILSFILILSRNLMSFAASDRASPQV
jgi:hypothetical protein